MIPGGANGMSMPTPMRMVSKSRVPAGSVEITMPKELDTGPPFSDNTWRS